MMHFLWLAIFGVGESALNRHKFFTPAPGWRFVVIGHFFPNCKDAFTILANSISRSPALLKYVNSRSQRCSSLRKGFKRASENKTLFKCIGHSFSWRWHTGSGATRRMVTARVSRATASVSGARRASLVDAAERRDRLSCKCSGLKFEGRCLTRTRCSSRRTCHHGSRL